MDPTSVVIRSPSKWLVPNPRPAIGRTPRPIAVAIRRPVAVHADRRRMRPPDPAKLVCIFPITVGFEIFGAPDGFVEVLDVVFDTLRPILLAVADPIVKGIVRRGGDEFPIA